MSTLDGVLYITGGTGFVGSALAQAWLGRNSLNRVIVQTREPARHQDTDQMRYVASLDEVQEVPLVALVNLAGAPIADKRWTPARKRVLETSRINLTRQLASSLRQRSVSPQVIVSASAIGFYGTGDTVRDESSGSGEGYAAELCQKWEAAAEDFAALSRLAIVRLGVVLGHGGALGKLLPLFRLGMGGPIAGGRQGFSWIHIDDVVRAILAIIDDPDGRGVFNLTAPRPVPQQDFARSLGAALGRPAFLPTPAFSLRLVFGQMAQELLIEGQFVHPGQLLARSFEFRYPDLDSALQAIISS